MPCRGLDLGAMWLGLGAIWFGLGAMLARPKPCNPRLKLYFLIQFSEYSCNVPCGKFWQVLSWSHVSIKTFQNGPRRSMIYSSICWLYRFLLLIITICNYIVEQLYVATWHNCQNFKNLKIKRELVKKDNGSKWD